MKELINLRKKLNYTQKEMADYLGISVSYYAKIENNSKLPSYNFINIIKKKFPECDTNIFFKE
ncbi:helix-turn-helix domain-containing protein [Acetobacterium wieringae]|uniref:helix-turn-helix domain-containing protein n=1 Tax=Acetobacterium wieringae TaxID=52694 RepID=UPI0026EC8B5D|nr:helix-turn-helix transcriptional regulator [Acetobacterium wieringae]MEA4805056.1 helix-turn-helix transcriptional regulator [Acetobacterium wieringae]